MRVAVKITSKTGIDGPEEVCVVSSGKAIGMSHIDDVAILNVATGTVGTDVVSDIVTRIADHSFTVRDSAGRRIQLVAPGLLIENPVSEDYLYCSFAYAVRKSDVAQAKSFMTPARCKRTNSFGQTALFWCKCLRMTRLCLEWGIDPLLRDARGRTAADFAKERGFLDVYDYLLKKQETTSIKE
jgi:phosphoribosylformylglycinamidine (FGAM) synthase PurS component